jgi:hypothetical protein
VRLINDRAPQPNPNLRAKRKDRTCTSILLCCFSVRVTNIASSKFTPPALRGNTVEWVYGSQEMVNAECMKQPQYKMMTESMKAVTTIGGCFKFVKDKCVIYTRAPSRGDSMFVDAVQHELAHCEGWVHPNYTD